MKTLTITAYANRGKDTEKKFEGEFEVPESLSEMTQMLTEEVVFDLSLATYINKLQNTLRKPNGPINAKTVEVYGKLYPMIEAGTITEEYAREVSGYEGEWPVPVADAEPVQEGVEA